MRYQFGRLPPRPTAMCDLSHYLTAPLPAPPALVEAPALKWPMAGNDTYGDCTLAAVVHVDQALSSLTGRSWTYVGDNAVEAQYLDMTGGEDTGLVETAVLQAWHRDGLFGHQLAAWAPIHPKHQVALKQTVALCGTVYMGVLVPAQAQAQFAARKPWALTHTHADFEIVGGHAVPYVGYNSTGPVAVTWGALQQVTWEWHNAYAEEGYAVITDEVKASGALRGVNFARLNADLSALKGL